MNKAFTSLLFTVVMIVIMISPAYAVHKIDDYSTSNIIAVEGLYNSGDYITNEPIDIDNVLDVENCDYLGEETGNDTAFINYVSGMGNDNAYFGNYLTYVGNGTYTIAIDYTDNPEVPATTGFKFVIPMNISTSELLSYDFLRFTTTFEADYYLDFQNDITGTTYTWQSIAVSTNETLFIPTLTVKSWLGNSVNSTVYLRIGESYENQFSTEPATINVQLEAFELEPEHQLEMQDTTFYFLTIGIADVVLIIAIAFTTQQIDIKIDKSKK